MQSEDGKHLYVSHDEYQNLIERLAVQIHQSGWAFDTILCLARGGMRPGDLLSRIFEKPLAIMSTSSYRADAGTVRGHLDIAGIRHHIPRQRGNLNVCHKACVILTTNTRGQIWIICRNKRLVSWNCYIGSKSTILGHVITKKTTRENTKILSHQIGYS